MLYREQADRYVIPKIGRIRLDKLRPMHLQRMVSELADEIGVPTANKARTLILNAFQQAVRWQLISHNPCDAVAKLKETRKEMVLWTPSESVHFLEAARPHRLYAAFYLALFTGLRRGEVLGLRWKDIRGPVLSVRQSLTVLGGTPHFTTPKTRKGERHVSLSADLLEVLTQHRQHQEAGARALGETWTESGLVFTSEVGTLIHPRNFERSFKRLLKDSKVTPVRLHDLRHLHVSLLVSRGFDPRSIADRVGHTNPSFTLDVYSHMFATQRQNMSVGMADLISSSGTRAQQTN
jgi:integrase